MKHDVNNFDHLKTRDLHVHTPHCHHAEGTMEDYVHAALGLGLDEIGFLAHAETGIRSSASCWLEHEDLDRYWEEGNDLRQRYETCITVSLGLELGLNPHSLPALMDIAGRHPWDRIGLSYHHLLNGDSHLNICSRESIPGLKQLDSLQMTLRYYSGLRDGIPAIRPNMICHLDVIRKHLEDRSNDPRVKSLIRQVLHEMEGANVALEVNTSGYDAVGEPYPASWIIREAVEMGIDLVLSSDSHKPSDVGRYFDTAALHISSSLVGIYAFKNHQKSPYQRNLPEEAVNP